MRATVREPILKEFPEGDLDNVDVGENWMETRPYLGVNAGGQLDDDSGLGAPRGRDNARAPERDVYESFAGRAPIEIERGGRVSAQAAQGDDELPHGSVLGVDDEQEVKERVKKQMPRSERTGAQTRQRKSAPNAAKKAPRKKSVKATKSAPPRSPKQKTSKGGG